MDAYHNYLNLLLNKNRGTFASYPGIRWLNPWQAEDYRAKRNHLLQNMGEQVLFKQTKPYYNQISPGCRICGEGKWSCLFITGKCNADCFYCPAPQNSDDLPESQGLTFETAEAYAEYINFFDFRGVSFSGGEPLLVKEKVFNYLKAIRQNCNSDIYTWMYTNGILADEQIFMQLADTGLNEIRFDIGAVNYDLSGVKKAGGIIPNITVEIPAVPEYKDKLKQMLPAMAAAGVTNLNLHQLRLTQHNAPKLMKRDYTYIPAEKPIVLESEIAALEILEYVRMQKLDLGVNYCSFYFKHRFQKAGYRRKVAGKLRNSDDFITEKGYLRRRNGAKIIYEALRLFDNTAANAASLPDLQLHCKKYKISREPARRIKIDDRDQLLVTDLLNKQPVSVPEKPLLFDIWLYEYIEEGLRDY